MSYRVDGEKKKLSDDAENNTSVASAGSENSKNSETLSVSLVDWHAVGLLSSMSSALRDDAVALSTIRCYSTST